MTSIFDANLWDVGKFRLKEVMTREQLIEIINNLDFEELYYAPCNMRTGHFICRSPGNQGDEQTRTWHNDCGGAPQYLAMWANYLPTELLPRWGQVRGDPVYLETSHLYLMNNSKFLHKMPRDAATHEKRWFVRYNIYTGRIKKIAKSLQ